MQKCTVGKKQKTRGKMAALGDLFGTNLDPKKDAKWKKQKEAKMEQQKGGKKAGW